MKNASAQSTKAMPHAKLWIDANQSYTPSNALELLKRVADIREIYCMEQPVASQDWFGMQRVRNDAPIPIAIDEGCFTYFDLAKIARLACADAVVLKVCKSGGLAECLKSVHIAEANALELLGSGLTEARNRVYRQRPPLLQRWTSSSPLNSTHLPSWKP